MNTKCIHVITLLGIFLSPVCGASMSLVPSTRNSQLFKGVNTKFVCERTAKKNWTKTATDFVSNHPWAICTGLGIGLGASAYVAYRSRSKIASIFGYSNATRENTNTKESDTSPDRENTNGQGANQGATDSYSHDNKSPLTPEDLAREVTEQVRNQRYKSNSDHENKPLLDQLYDTHDRASSEGKQQNNKTPRKYLKGTTPLLSTTSRGSYPDDPSPDNNSAKRKTDKEGKKPIKNHQEARAAFDEYREAQKNACKSNSLENQSQEIKKTGPTSSEVASAHSGALQQKTYHLTTSNDIQGLSQQTIQNVIQSLKPNRWYKITIINDKTEDEEEITFHPKYADLSKLRQSILDTLKQWRTSTTITIQAFAGGQELSNIIETQINQNSSNNTQTLGIGQGTSSTPNKIEDVNDIKKICVTCHSNKKNQTFIIPQQATNTINREFIKQIVNAIKKTKQSKIAISFNDNDKKWYVETPSDPLKTIGTKIEDSQLASTPEELLKVLTPFIKSSEQRKKQQENTHAATTIQSIHETKKKTKDQQDVREAKAQLSNAKTAADFTKLRKDIQNLQNIARTKTQKDEVKKLQQQRETLQAHHQSSTTHQEFQNKKDAATNQQKNPDKKNKNKGILKHTLANAEKLQNVQPDGNDVKNNENYSANIENNTTIINNSETKIAPQPAQKMRGSVVSTNFTPIETHAPTSLLSLVENNKESIHHFLTQQFNDDENAANEEWHRLKVKAAQGAHLVKNICTNPQEVDIIKPRQAQDLVSYLHLVLATRQRPDSTPPSNWTVQITDPGLKQYFERIKNLSWQELYDAGFYVRPHSHSLVKKRLNKSDNQLDKPGVGLGLDLCNDGSNPISNLSRTIIIWWENEKLFIKPEPWGTNKLKDLSGHTIDFFSSLGRKAMSKLGFASQDDADDCNKERVPRDVKNILQNIDKEAISTLEEACRLQDAYTIYDKAVENGQLSEAAQKAMESIQAHTCNPDQAYGREVVLGQEDVEILNLLLENGQEGQDFANTLDDVNKKYQQAVRLQQQLKKTTQKSESERVARMYKSALGELKNTLGKIETAWNKTPKKNLNELPKRIDALKKMHTQEVFRQDLLDVPVNSLFTGTILSHRAHQFDNREKWTSFCEQCNQAQNLVRKEVLKNTKTDKEGKLAQGTTTRPKEVPTNPTSQKLAQLWDKIEELKQLVPKTLLQDDQAAKQLHKLAGDEGIAKDAQTELACSRDNLVDIFHDKLEAAILERKNTYTTSTPLPKTHKLKSELCDNAFAKTEQYINAIKSAYGIGDIAYFQELLAQTQQNAPEGEIPQSVRSCINEKIVHPLEELRKILQEKRLVNYRSFQEKDRQQLAQEDPVLAQFAESLEETQGNIGKLCEIRDPNTGIDAHFKSSIQIMLKSLTQMARNSKTPDGVNVKNTLSQIRQNCQNLWEELQQRFENKDGTCGDLTFGPTTFEPDVKKQINKIRNTYQTKVNEELKKYRKMMEKAQSVWCLRGKYSEEKNNITDRYKGIEKAKTLLAEERDVERFGLLLQQPCERNKIYDTNGQLTEYGNKIVEDHKKTKESELSRILQTSFRDEDPDIQRFQLSYVFVVHGDLAQGNETSAENFNHFVQLCEQNPARKQRAVNSFKEDFEPVQRVSG